MKWSRLVKYIKWQNRIYICILDIWEFDFQGVQTLTAGWIFVRNKPKSASLQSLSTAYFNLVGKKGLYWR